MGTTRAAASARRLRRLLGAIGVTAWVVTATGQTAVPATLSPTLRDHVKNDRFQLVTSIRGLPLGVRETLQTVFGGETLDMAESPAEFQGSEVSAAPKRRLRRLAAAGCSMDHCLIYYQRGGSDPAWLAVLFSWTPAETRCEWGGRAPGGLTTLDEVRDAVIAGKVTGPVTRW